MEKKQIHCYACDPHPCHKLYSLGSVYCDWILQNEKMYEDSYFSDVLVILKLRQVHQKCQMKFNRGYRHDKLPKIQLTQHQVWRFFQGQTDRQSLKLTQHQVWRFFQGQPDRQSLKLTQHQVWRFFQGQTDRQSLKTHKSFTQVAHKYACTHTPACMLIHSSTHTPHTYLVQKQHQLLVGGRGKNCWLQFLTATAQWVSGIQHFQYNIRCINNLQPIHFQLQK